MEETGEGESEQGAEAKEAPNKRQRLRRAEQEHETRREATDDVPQGTKRQNLTDDVPQQVRQHLREQTRRQLTDAVPQSMRQNLAGKRRSEQRDDVPLHFKRTRGPPSNGLLCEALAAEHSEASQAKANARGKGEFNITKLIKESADPANVVKKLQEALEKEWSTGSKHDAVTIVPPKDAAKVPHDFITDARGVWTNKGQNLDEDFQPKCRIVGKGFHDDKDPTRQPDMFAPHEEPTVQRGGYSTYEADGR